MDGSKPIGGGGARIIPFETKQVGSPPGADHAVATLKLEQLMWAEMLSHAGFEKALANGADDASTTFVRFLVESIAADLANSHPFGLGGAEADGGEVVANDNPRSLVP